MILFSISVAAVRPASGKGANLVLTRGLYVVWEYSHATNSVVGFPLKQAELA
jgi:hypothetical protein